MSLSMVSPSKLYTESNNDELKSSFSAEKFIDIESGSSFDISSRACMFEE